MRRRRRTRGTWFPNLGTNTGGSENDNVQGLAFTFDFPALDAGSQTIISALTYDVEHGEDADPSSTTSLADIIGSEYVLQRIVGKLFASRASTLSGGVDIAPAVLISCGFFVARANDSAVGGGFNTPVGSASADERRDNYSPLDLDNVREPWIWRRSWVLGNAGQAGNAAAAFGATRNFPASTALYGSVADGPHIDSKVKRRVAQDNRLWLGIAAVPFPIGEVPPLGSELSCSGYIDYRIFGSLRKARQQSAF